MTKEQKECPGCQRPWNGDSIYCSICQAHGVGGQEGGLGAMVASFKPGIEENNRKYPDPCGKCGKPNSVTSIGWFCADCSQAMDLSERIRKVLRQ